jgi:hypothetical protein
VWQEIWGKRNKTLLYLVPPNLYGRQEAVAYQLPSVNVIDWREEFLRTVRPDQRHLNLTVQGELERLKQYSDERGGILCFINTEYMLTRFDRSEREAFWRGLWSDFPYCQSVIVFSVLDSPELLPTGINFEQWEASGRVIRPPEPGRNGAH